VHPKGEYPWQIQRFGRETQNSQGAVMDITIGRVVTYTLTEQDALEINRRRTDGKAIAERIKKNTEDTSAWPIGAQAHIGNSVEPGQQFPMVVTKVWSPGYVNGQVLLDGNDCFWATSVKEGTGGHTWAWPARVEEKTTLVR
jgi:hypothetical protein